MVARSDLSAASRASQQLDDVQRALDALAAGASVTGIIVRNGDVQIFVDVPVPTNAIQTLLTNRKAAIQTQLTSLGVT